MDRFKNKTRELIADWDSALNPPDRFLFFEKVESIPAFSPQNFSEFSPTNAWWLAELCRLAYTPDSKEIRYLRNRNKQPRAEWLTPQTTFTEVHSIHKTGNHASIYLGQIPETEERFTVLCFRGTSRFRQWVMNFTATPRDWEFSDRTRGVHGATVHAGFDIFIKRIWPQLHERLLSLPRPFIFTGHSLGGALATLATAEENPDLLLTFGAPRVGNRHFTDLIKGTPHFRVINDLDLVPHVPPAEVASGDREFQHVGEAIFLTSNGKIAPVPDLPENINAMDLLQDAFRKPTPPACVMDHLMGSYCRKLRSAIEPDEIDSPD